MLDADIQNTLIDLAGNDPHRQRQARQTIQESMDERFVDGLLHMLGDANLYLQRECINLLGRLGYPQALPVLMDLLNHDSLDEELQEDVIIALGRIGDDQAVESLLAMVDHRNFYIRQRIATALGSFNADKSVQALTTMIEDESEEVRAFAARSLGLIGDVSSIKVLDDALDDVSWSVRKQAVRALAQFNDDAVIEPMIYALEDIRSPIRVIAAKKLGEIGTPLAYEPLLQARHPFRRDVNHAIDTALDKLDGKYIRDPDMDISLLIDLLPVHHKPEVIAQTLETIGTPDALAAVKAWRATQSND